MRHQDLGLHTLVVALPRGSFGVGLSENADRIEHRSGSAGMTKRVSIGIDLVMNSARTISQAIIWNR